MHTAVFTYLYHHHHQEQVLCKCFWQQRSVPKTRPQGYKVERTTVKGDAFFFGRFGGQSLFRCCKVDFWSHIFMCFFSLCSQPAFDLLFSTRLSTHCPALQFFFSCCKRTTVWRGGNCFQKCSLLKFGLSNSNIVLRELRFEGLIYQQTIKGNEKKKSFS